MAKKTTAIALPRVEEPWEAKLRERAKERRSVETLGLPRVQYPGGQFEIGGKKIPGNKLTIVPVGLFYTKSWYEFGYQPGAKDSPGCYAFGEGSDKGLVPHPAVPKKQSETCDQCPHNQFGTAEKGRGKRCSDKRRVIFILSDDLKRAGEKPSPEEITKAVAKAQLYQIDVPSGSLRGFGTFLTSLQGVTPHDDITEAVCEVFSTPQTQAFTIDFRFLDKVPSAFMPALVARGEPLFQTVNQPYPVIAQEEAAVPVKGQGAKSKRK